MAVQTPATTRRSNSRRGAVTPWMALCLAVILGIVAFGMDGGRMYHERRRVQATADAAALAAAALLYENHRDWLGKDPYDKAAGAARSVAAANGYNNDGVSNSVAVHVPPKSGEFTGQDDFVEVIVESKLAGGFARVFARDELKVRARAVARGRPARLGVIALANSGASAVLNKAKGTFTVLNAPIIVNSSDASALRNESLLPMIARNIDVVGNYVNASGGLIIANVATGAEPTADPLQFLPAPDPSAYVLRSAAKLKISSALPLPTILNPGTYRGGIDISGQSLVTFMPGVYVIDGGGLTVGGLATLAGLDVTIFNTGSVANPAGPISLTSLGKLALTPPLGGTYQGISIFQDRGVNVPLSLSGNGLGAVVGVIYAPNAPVSLTGNAIAGVDILGGAVIADTISVGGLGSVTVNLGWNYPRVPDINLVE
jgi:Putative Flp pilus-assembly TadE/G-like